MPFWQAGAGGERLKAGAVGGVAGKAKERGVCSSCVVFEDLSRDTFSAGADALSL